MDFKEVSKIRRKLSLINKSPSKWNDDVVEYLSDAYNQLTQQNNSEDIKQLINDIQDLKDKIFSYRSIIQLKYDLRNLPIDYYSLQIFPDAWKLERKKTNNDGLILCFAANKEFINLSTEGLKILSPNSKHKYLSPQDIHNLLQSLIDFSIIAIANGRVYFQLQDLKSTITSLDPDDVIGLEVQFENNKVFTICSTRSFQEAINFLFD